MNASVRERRRTSTGVGSAGRVEECSVIRLRFVQQYRDRRIVTNGKLYGIEGELVTDCRYLNVEGARAAINSEAGIAARRASIDWQREQLAEYIAREGHLLRAQVHQEPPDRRDGVIEHALVSLARAVREVEAEADEDLIVERRDLDPVPPRKAANVDRRAEVSANGVWRMACLGE